MILPRRPATSAAQQQSRAGGWSRADVQAHSSMAEAADVVLVCLQRRRPLWQARDRRRRVEPLALLLASGERRSRAGDVLMRQASSGGWGGSCGSLGHTLCLGRLVRRAQGVGRRGEALIVDWPRTVTLPLRTASKQLRGLSPPSKCLLRWNGRALSTMRITNRCVKAPKSGRRRVGERCENVTDQPPAWLFPVLSMGAAMSSRPRAP